MDEAQMAQWLKKSGLLRGYEGGSLLALDNEM
jgi:hypothetical protein